MNRFLLNKVLDYQSLNFCSMLIPFEESKDDDHTLVFSAAVLHQQIKLQDYHPVFLYISV